MAKTYQADAVVIRGTDEVFLAAVVRMDPRIELTQFLVPRTLVADLQTARSQAPLPSGGRCRQGTRYQQVTLWRLRGRGLPHSQMVFVSPPHEGSPRRSHAEPVRHRSRLSHDNSGQPTVPRPEVFHIDFIPKFEMLLMAAVLHL